MVLRISVSLIFGCAILTACSTSQSPAISSTAAEAVCASGNSPNDYFSDAYKADWVLLDEGRDQSYIDDIRRQERENLSRRWKILRAYDKQTNFISEWRDLLTREDLPENVQLHDDIFDAGNDVWELRAKVDASCLYIAQLIGRGVLSSEKTVKN